MRRNSGAILPVQIMLYVPEVYFDYCRTDVMVMERIRGVPISDMDSLRRAGC